MLIQNRFDFKCFKFRCSSTACYLSSLRNILDRCFFWRQQWSIYVGFRDFCKKKNTVGEQKPASMSYSGEYWLGFFRSFPFFVVLNIIWNRLLSHLEDVWEMRHHPNFKFVFSISLFRVQSNGWLGSVLRRFIGLL